MISIVEVIQKSDSTLPKRNRAEVFVMKNGNLLVGQPRGWGGFAIPGGGIDPGETPEKAAIRETLEELGVRVKNLRTYKKPKWIPYYIVDNQLSYAKDYAEQYSGTYFHTFIGEFDKEDKSKWGKEPDSFSVKEVTIDEAIKFFTKHAREQKNKDPYNYQKAMYVLEVLRSLK